MVVAMPEYSERDEAKLEGARRSVRWLAHELNNALGTISGCAQLIDRLLSQPDPSAGIEKSKGYAKSIHAEATRCSQLLMDVVLSIQEVDLHPTESDIHSILDAALAKALPDDGSGITVYRTYDKSVPQVPVDQALIEQAFHSIFLNAVQAMPTGGDLRLDTCYIAGPDSGGVVKIYVTDTGSGVSESAVGQVFTPFFSTKNRSRGLGLSLAASTIRRHGGEIKLHSVEGRGTTVEITLPVRLSEP